MSATALSNEARRGHPKKREAIIQAASQAFVERGYGISVDEIAAAAGVSKQTIYNQFGSKEELFHAIVAERSAQLVAPFAGNTESKAPRDVLLEYARGYFEFVLTPQGLSFLRMLIGASHDFPGLPRDFYEAGPNQTQEAIMTWLRREHSRGRLRVPDPQMAAEHLTSLIFGRLMLRGLLGLEIKMAPGEIERRSAYCVDLFLAGHGVAFKARGTRR